MRRVWRDSETAMGSSTMISKETTKAEQFEAYLKRMPAGTTFAEAQSLAFEMACDDLAEARAKLQLLRLSSIQQRQPAGGVEDGLCIYHGYSYPKVLDNRVMHWFWKRVFCRTGWHLWDEVSSVENYLFCDACEIMYPAKKED